MISRTVKFGVDRARFCNPVASRQRSLIRRATNMGFSKPFLQARVYSNGVSTAERLQQHIPEKDMTQQLMLKPVDQFEPIKDSFAVVLVGGHQYKVTEGDEVMVNKLDAPLLSQLLLDKVLLVGTKDYTVIGHPILTKAKVLAIVEEQTKAEKIIVFNKKRKARTNRKRQGHRQNYSLLRIVDVLVEK